MRTHVWIADINGSPTATPVVANVPFEEFASAVVEAERDGEEWITGPLIEVVNGVEHQRMWLLRVGDILRAEDGEMEGI